MKKSWKDETEEKNEDDGRKRGQEEKINRR